MTTRLRPDLDFSSFPESDGEPMAETIENMTQMIDLMFALRGLLAAQGHTRVAVGGNQFLYYNPHNGREHVSPDVYVALDVPPGDRPTWKTWEEGKCPDIVFEITSPSTQNEDVGPKRDLYARLGAREYYIYDPQDLLRPRFQGFVSRAGRLEPLPYLPNGGIASPLLETELRPVGVYLRAIDPATGTLLLTPEEARRAYAALRGDYQAVEERLSAAEQRATQAEAELEALRATLSRQQGRGSTDADEA